MDPIEAESDLNATHKTEATIHHAEKMLANDDMKKTPIPTLTTKQAFRFKLKMDLHILPMLGIIYALSIIDRINIGSAKVLGMSRKVWEQIEGIERSIRWQKESEGPSPNSTFGRQRNLCLLMSVFPPPYFP